MAGMDCSMMTTDAVHWNWAWNGRTAMAMGLSEMQVAEGASAGDELFQQCLNVEGEGFKRVVFFGEDDRSRIIQLGQDLFQAGGHVLLRYAVFDLAVKLMEDGRYDLLSDVQELAWCWNLPI